MVDEPHSTAFTAPPNAGCATAAANLWDVTDRDIDRFSTAVLNDWSNADSGSTGHSSGGSSSTGHSSGGGGGGGGHCNAHGSAAGRAITVNRGACRLPHLIGAAPVCYGIPAYVLPGSRPRMS